MAQKYGSAVSLVSIRLAAGERAFRCLTAIQRLISGVLLLAGFGVLAQEAPPPVSGVAASWTGARQALDAANSQMAAGAFKAAEKSLQTAKALVPEDSELKGDVETALYFQLPGLVVRSLLSTGQVEEARQVLKRAMNIASPYPQYMQMLTAMEADLNKSNLLGAGIPTIEIDGRAVLGVVNNALRSYQSQLGRYPSSLAAVNRMLPPGEPPLEVFFISGYRTTGSGFQLELTNRNNPEQVLRIDHTGLMR
jgi:hypothetical protein